jgi:hypothetical protein
MELYIVMEHQQIVYSKFKGKRLEI